MHFGESGAGPMDGRVFTGPQTSATLATGMERRGRKGLPSDVVAGIPPADRVVIFRDSGRRCPIALRYETRDSMTHKSLFLNGVLHFRVMRLILVTCGSAAPSDRV
jgi:hypothetical protein